MHIMIIAGKSNYFWCNLFNGDDHARANSYKLNIDSKALELIISFCYTGCVELTVDNVESVLLGAKELQMDSLISVCTEMLEDILNIDNCVHILEIADKQELDSIKQNAIALIAEELPHIDRLPEFFLLNGSQMFWLIQLLSNSQDGIFDELLQSLDSVESTFAWMKPDVLTDSDTQSAIRAAVSPFFLISFNFLVVIH